MLKYCQNHKRIKTNEGEHKKPSVKKVVFFIGLYMRCHPVVSGMCNSYTTLCTAWAIGLWTVKKILTVELDRGGD